MDDTRQQTAYINWQHILQRATYITPSQSNTFLPKWIVATLLSPFEPQFRHFLLMIYVRHALDPPTEDETSVVVGKPSLLII